MEKEITATFIGHKECFGLENEAVKAELVKLIEQGVCVFLNGGMGGFDWKCAGILRDLKGSSCRCVKGEIRMTPWHARIFC